MAEKEKKASDDDVIKDALEQFNDAWAGSEHNRTAYHDDFAFARLNEQWPADIKKQREQEARPCLTINKLPAFIRAIVNEARQTKPAIQVSPVDNGADEDTAEVIGGLIRSVERMSNAEVAYDTAIDHAVTGGFGFFAIEIAYAHDGTFDLEARFRRIPNALQVIHDPSSTEFDASDWDYGFISEMMSKDEYKRNYPDASMVPFDGGSQDDASANWMVDNEIRIAEYYLREPKTRVLIQFAVTDPKTGKTDLRAIREEDLPGMARRYFEAGGIKPFGGSDTELAKQFINATGLQERRRRDVEYHKVMRRIINGVEVLEEVEWPGSRIPICPVWGDEVYLDGKRYFRSMIRDAKDPQTMFNFWRSSTTELVALAPRAPWIGPKGFIPSGDEDKWASANTRSHPYLEYNPVQGAPAPQRTPFAGIPAGALQEALSASDDMKSVMSIYNPSLGAEDREKSGVAIRARQAQSDTSNFHFIDNLSRAIQYAGSILVEIIPSVYSVRSSIRILGEDEAEKVINLTQEGGSAFQQDGKLYNLTVGKYDVAVKTGPSFATQREETRETLIEIGKQVPEAMPFIADVLMDHMDFVGADKIAKRMRFLLPPEVRQAEDAAGDDDNPEAAAAQQALKKQGEQFQQVQQQVMAEVEKIKAENEALKADKTAQMQKVQTDGMAKKAELDLKGRELRLKEGEAAAKTRAEVTPQVQWENDRMAEEDKRAFEAVQNEKDRQVDLAKTIISNAEEGDTGEGMAAAGEEAMLQALTILGSPRRVIRDENGNITGTEIVT